jgi:acyl-coenzyme A thioesterase PaaI-like protein
MPQHERVHGHELKKEQIVNNCFGCGPGNQAGLRLEFVLDKQRERFVCHFQLEERFVGPPGHAHGGIIATILDEAMGKVNKLREVIALTGRMEVDYLLPVPLSTPLMVEGWEVRVNGREHIHAAKICSGDGEVLAESIGKFIEIDPHRMFAKHLKKTHSDAT